jgi:hypothetical protein
LIRKRHLQDDAVRAFDGTARNGRNYCREGAKVARKAFGPEN